MIKVTDANFTDEVLGAARPTLVDFWAAWCAPCHMVAPVVEALASEYDSRLKVVKFDVDTNPNTPARLGIMGIPTLILFKGGSEVERLVGYRPRAALEEAIVPHLS